ncbi:UNVERIFIED_CONTAM: hypothetical protein K2H54_005232 [Gekko kuhli]
MSPRSDMSMLGSALVSLQAFESTLKSWEDKQKCDSCKPVLRPPLYPQQAVELATEEEAAQIQFCSQAAEELITRICEAAKIHNLLEQELAHAVNACSHALNGASLRFPESLTRNIALEVAVSVKALHDETESLLVGRVPLQLESPHEELLSMAVQSLEAELRKLAEIPWLHYVLQLNDDEVEYFAEPTTQPFALASSNLTMPSLLPIPFSVLL